MTIEEARKILGPKYDKLPDSKIEELILLYTQISSVIIDEYKKDPEALIKKLDDIQKEK